MQTNDQTEPTDQKKQPRSAYPYYFAMAVMFLMTISFLIGRNNAYEVATTDSNHQRIDPSAKQSQSEDVKYETLLILSKDSLFEYKHKIGQPITFDSVQETLDYYKNKKHK